MSLNESIKITDIRSCWERIKPGLEIVRRKCNADWRVEDVYAKCVSDSWTLFTADGVDGFLICWQFTSDYSGAKTLMIEVAYYHGPLHPFDVYQPFLDDLARSIGAKDIEFRSPRMGFLRKGWTEVDVVYRREVPCGQESEGQ